MRFISALIASIILPAAAISAAELPAQQFDMTDVKLLDGPFKAAQDADAKYILSLDPERLLHVFRLNAKLPSTAKPLGGWEAPTCEVRGHFVGHYLSALAMMYAITGDAEFKKRADHMVEELGKCQDAIGTGYLSAFPDSHFDRLEAGKPVWAPYYCIHKIMAGLLDINLHCQNQQALVIASRMADYFKKRTDKLSENQMQFALGNEYGGMMECLAELSARTGNADYLALSKRFEDHVIFAPLEARKDVLAGNHANTNIPKMTGAARLYELTGDERYRKISQYFWDIVTGHHSFITGGNSFSETFRAPDVEATLLLANDSETCNTYNMLKLTSHVFERDPQPAYFDFYEKALFNHILGSIDTGNGATMYYLSLLPGHFKVYSTPTDSFWCCTGTGLENHARYNEVIYYHNDKKLWVNLFIASELNWKEAGITLKQDTKFPEEPETKLTLHMDKPTECAINLRIPEWADGATVKVNGEAAGGEAKPGTYVTLDREWKNDDKIEMSLPMKLHLYHPKDAPKSIAIVDGPIVLAGEFGTKGEPELVYVPDPNQLNNVPLPKVPTLVNPTEDVQSWLKPVAGKPLTFTTTATDQSDPVELIPLYAIHHQRYTVYWNPPAQTP